MEKHQTEREEVLAREFSRRSFLAKAGAAGLVVAGAGTLGGTLAGGAASATTKTAKVPLVVKRSESVVGTLPKFVQQYYELATTTPLGPSIYKNWKPKRKPPWKIGFASAFAGNSWRMGTLDRLNSYLIGAYKDAGLISEVVTLQSNLVISTQIQQIRQLVDQGCDAVFTIGPPPTSLNDAIKYCYQHGVLFVAQQGGVTSPYAQQVSGNYALCGKLQGTSLGQSIGGKGNVLIVQGIPQTQASADFQRGHELGLAAYKGIDVVGVVAGTWVDSVAKTAVLNFLDTHPQPLAGIATQSPGDLGALQALQGSGRKVVPMTIGGEIGPLVYWKEHKSWINSMYQAWPPGDEMQECWEVMMRTLEGQGPKIASIMIGAGAVYYKNLQSLLPANASLTSNLWIEPAQSVWFPKTTMDMYFTHPADPLAWRP
ncbi:MAG: substrate-binding domain-containing protein [Acidimicrobiales bacterium]|jgi:ribose transport system substrate-binding protein